MSRVWEASQHKGSALVVLLAIADNANDEGWAWPSQETLAAKARMSERQVRRVTDELVASGELEVHQQQDGRKRHNRYRVRPDKMSASHATTGHPGSLRPDIAMSGEPSVEPPRTSEANASSVADAPDFDPIPIEEARSAKQKHTAVYDAILRVCAITPSDVTARSAKRVAQIAGQLRNVGATDTDVEERARAYHAHPTLGSCMLTPEALEKHWAALAPAAKATAARPPCPRCGIGGGMHTADCPTIEATG